MSDQKNLLISEALRKRVYRAKLKDQLGEEAYIKNKHKRSVNTALKSNKVKHHKNNKNKLFNKLYNKLFKM